MTLKVAKTLCVIGLLYVTLLLILEQVLGVCFSGTCSIYPILGGLAWFGSGLFVLRGRILVKVWQTIGLVGITYFAFLELYTNHFCLLCTIAHLIGLATIYLSLDMDIRSFF